MKLTLPKRGVCVLHGNTMDLYEGKTLEGLLLQSNPHKHLVGLSPDRGLWSIKCAEQEWATIEKGIPKGAMGGPTIGQLLEYATQLARSRPLTILVDYCEAILGAEKWDPGCCSARHVVTIMRLSDEEAQGLVVLVARHRLWSLHPALWDGHAPIAQVEVPPPDEALRSTLHKDGARAAGLTERQITSSKPDEWSKLQTESVERATGGVFTAKWCDTPWEYVGGLTEVKQYIQEELLPCLERNDPWAPMGTMFVGPPGTGKSIVAEALATALSRPHYEMKGGPIRSSFVGVNEDRMQRGLKLISTTGGLLFLDEGDKMFSDPDAYQGDSGVQNRITMMMHDFLSDTRHRGKIFCVLACNRAHALPQSLRRAGRFDTVIPFVPPVHPKERLAILQALAKRHKLEHVTDKTWMEIAKGTRLWTGADLEALMLSLARRSAGKITVNTVRETLEYWKPSVPEEQMTEMVKQAQLACRDDRLLPDPNRYGDASEEE